MSDIERKLRDQTAHVKALTDSLSEANKTIVQLRAQTNALQESSERHLREAAQLIDNYAARIEVMVENWLLQNEGRADISEEEKAKLAKEIVAFRPQRIGEVQVTPSRG